MYQDWADPAPDLLEHEDGQDVEVMVYNPSGLNFAMEDHFIGLQPQLPIALGGATMSALMQLCPAHLDDSSPVGLLYVAVYSNQPELHVPVLKRKRLEKGKHIDHALATALCTLQNNPTANVGWPLNKLLRKAGHREYARQFGLRRCMYYRAAKDQTQTVFYQQPDSVIGSWVVMALVSRIMYTTTPRGLVLKALPGQTASSSAMPECAGLAVHDDKFKFHSALFTWHSDVGLHHPDMMSLVASSSDCEKMESRMEQMPCYALEFKLFCKHIQQIVATSLATCYACCIEHCRHGQLRGRVHFHAYIGCAASWTRDAGMTPPLLELPQSMLVFRGYKPHGRLIRLKGANSAKQGNFNACQGVYYIMAPKLGQLFSCGSHLPFEERST